VLNALGFEHEDR